MAEALVTSHGGCHHYPPNWHWQGDTYRNTREIVRFTERNSEDTLEYLIKHGTTKGLVHSPEYLEMVRLENAWYVSKPCSVGNCVDQFCPLCGDWKGGWGPVGCPCEDGYWKGPCPDQWRMTPAPVKPSAARRSRRRLR
jgi:hypothetical protein